MLEFVSTQPGGERVNYFPETHWSLVLAAIDRGSSQGSDALGRLYSIYRYPLYAYIRRLGYSPHDAEDLLQQFFARIVEGHCLTDFQRGGGKFRSFLLTSMKNYLANQRDRARTLKRGGGQELLSLDLVDAEGRYQLEPADPVEADHLFDQRWSTTLLAHVFQRLRQEYATVKKTALFDDLSDFLGGKAHGSEYATIADRHRITENVVKVTVHRLRKRYGEILREEVVRTVSSPEEVDEEIRHLIASACRPT